MEGELKRAAFVTDTEDVVPMKAARVVDTDDDVYDDDEDDESAESQDVLILWETPCGKVPEDAVLVVGTQKIAVNKAYLSLFAEFFQNIFYGDYKEKRTQEFVIEEKEEDFVTLLEVLLPIRKPIDVNNVEVLLEMADRRLIECLKKECLRFLLSPAASSMSIVKLLYIAFEYDSQHLKNHCKKQLLTLQSVTSLREADDFDDLPLEAHSWLFHLMSDISTKKVSKIENVEVEEEDDDDDIGPNGELILWEAPGGDVEGDATLKVGERKIAINKPYLAWHSEYFYQMFYDDAEKISTTEFEACMTEEVDEDEFVEMLRVVLPTRKEVDETNVSMLLKLAGCFKIRSLKRDCLAFLSRPEIFFELSEQIVIGFQYESSEIKKRCAERLPSQDHVMSLSMSDNFARFTAEARSSLFLQIHKLPRECIDRAKIAKGARPRVFFDVTIDGRAQRRIVIELFTDVVPKTAENFRSLCTGERGIGSEGEALHYKGCSFHAVETGTRVMGGDIVCGDGTSGDSIYGYAFERENFTKSHSGPGVLSMEPYNSENGAMNRSAFSIFARTAKHFDYANVVLGQVVEGMGTVDAMARVQCVDSVRNEDASVLAVRIMQTTPVNIIEFV